jgi:hypothetical protein
MHICTAAVYLSRCAYACLPCSKVRELRESTEDSMTLHLETRYEQLRVACELELWGEAFRSVEDIQQLIAITKKVSQHRKTCELLRARRRVCWHLCEPRLTPHGCCSPVCADAQEHAAAGVPHAPDPDLRRQRRAAVPLVCVVQPAAAVGQVQPHPSHGPIADRGQRAAFRAVHPALRARQRAQRGHGHGPRGRGAGEGARGAYGRHLQHAPGVSAASAKQ